MWFSWRDGAFFQTLLSDDHVEVGVRGITRKAAVVAGVASPACIVRSFSLDSIELTQFSATTALLTYHAAQETRCNGRAVPSPVWASSLYERRGDRWVNALYQQTPVLSSFAPGASAQETGPIVSEGVVEAPLHAVWSAWTTSAGLRSWLAPHADIDLRIGGLMRTNYNAQGALGDSQTIENTILSFEPARMISIKVAQFPDGFPFPNTIGGMWTVIYFDEVSQDRTWVRVVGLGFGTDEESQRMRAFFDRGNAATLRQLQQHFSGGGRH